MTPTPLNPCSHREVLAGPLATTEDLATWAAELAAAPCPTCAAPPPVRPEPPALPDLPKLPDEVVEALRWERADGARRAQRYLDKRGIAAELLPAVADQIAHQSSTSPYWRRWWAGWRDGVLLALVPPPPCHPEPRA